CGTACCCSGRSICRARCRNTRARCTRATSRASSPSSSRTALCGSTSTTRSFATPASPTPGRCGSHDRLLVHAVRARTGDVHRAGRDPPRVPAALHAAHVAHQRDLGHRRGGLHRRGGRRLPGDDPHPRRGRAVRLHDEHRERLPDHGPDAEDVQEAVTYAIAQLAAVLATALFIFSLHWMNDPKTARRGVVAGVTGSLRAAGKLQEVKWIPQRPVTYPGQNVVNVGVLVIAVALGVLVAVHPTAAWSGQVFSAIVGLAVLFGVLLIIPIGGADMPTVISILNSYAGLSAVAMGFVLNNKLLVTAGALDGSSGLILSIIMCRAMNRSFTNVLFGAFGTVQKTAAIGEQKEWKQET